MRNLNFSLAPTFCFRIISHVRYSTPRRELEFKAFDYSTNSDITMASGNKE